LGITFKMHVTSVEVWPIEWDRTYIERMSEGDLMCIRRDLMMEGKK